MPSENVIGRYTQGRGIFSDFIFLNLCLLSSHMESLSACCMSFDIQALTEMYSFFLFCFLF